MNGLSFAVVSFVLAERGPRAAGRSLEFDQKYVIKGVLKTYLAQVL